MVYKKLFALIIFSIALAGCLDDDILPLDDNGSGLGLERGVFKILVPFLKGLEPVFIKSYRMAKLLIL